MTLYPLCQLIVLSVLVFLTPSCDKKLRRRDFKADAFVLAFSCNLNGNLPSMFQKIRDSVSGTWPTMTCLLFLLPSIRFMATA